MALTPDQIAQEISDLGIDLPQSLADVIQAAADIAIENIKAGLQTSPDSSGALRSSITAIVDEAELTLGISMLDYGYFQNFGVIGTKNRTIQKEGGLDKATAEAFGVSEGYEFKFNSDNKMIGGDLPFGVRVKIHRDGLNAKEFLDLDAFLESVELYVNENLEL